jgi:hypothetical protein
MRCPSVRLVLYAVCGSQKKVVVNTRDKVSRFAAFNILVQHSSFCYGNPRGGIIDSASRRPTSNRTPVLWPSRILYLTPRRWPVIIS